MSPQIYESQALFFVGVNVNFFLPPNCRNACRNKPRMNQIKGLTRNKHLFLSGRFSHRALLSDRGRVHYYIGVSYSRLNANTVDL